MDKSGQMHCLLSHKNFYSQFEYGHLVFNETQLKLFQDRNVATLNRILNTGYHNHLYNLKLSLCF